MRLALIVLIWLGAAASSPVTRKLQPVNDTVSTVANRSNSTHHKGKIEIQSPAVKVSKEDLISWITYAMRLMASKINITLETAEHDDSLPRENIEKLRNSSLMLNHFIDDLKEETKRFNATKSLMSAGFKSHDVRSMMRDKGLDQQTKASNVEQTTQYAKSQNFDFFTNRPVDIQNIVRPPDPRGSLNLVQIRNHIAYPAHATPPATNEAATNAMTTMMAAGEGGTISVPFEAYVTITRDGATLVQPTTIADMGTTTKMPRQQQQQQQSQMQKKNKKKTQQGSKGSHGASTEEVPEKVTSPERGKKKNNSNKTEVLFEGDATTAKSSNKNKNKKKKTTTRRPSLLSMFMNRGKKKKPQKQSDDDEDFNDEDANSDFGGQSNQDEYTDDDNGGGGGGGSDADSGFRDDYEYDEDEGSLGSLEDLIPLVIPILEDISDPESETDLGEFLAAAVPLLQGISEVDPETGEGPDIVGVLLPVLQTVSVGKDGMGSDSGAILGPLIQLIGPFIGPLFGPLAGPLSSTLSGNGPNGIALGKILGSLSRYSAEEMDGMSIITGIVSSVLPILSKELSGPDSNIDVGKIVSQVVVGTSSGLSTGLSGGSSTGGDHPGYAYGPPAPAYGAPPASPAQANFANFLNPPPPGRPASFQAPSKRPSSSTSTGAKKPNKSSFFRPQATQYRPQATHAETPAESNQKNKHKPPATNYSYNNNNNHNYHNSYQPPNRYPNHHDSYESAEDHHYGAYGPPRVNPFDLLGKSIKELLSGSINLFSAILSTSTASAGASSQQSAAGSASGSSSPPAMQGYGYGPPATHYGAPTINNQNYQAPQKFG